MLLGMTPTLFSSSEGSVMNGKRMADMDLDEMQAWFEITQKRAELALRAYRTDNNGIKDWVLTRDELRAVLLPALGLEADHATS